MNFLHAILLGIVEGLTEFLPVSSTGHMILASTLLRLSDSEFLSSFEIAIQLGAILSVVVLYARRFLEDRDIVKKVIVAFLPTAIIGLFAYKFVKTYLLGNEYIVLWALAIGGVLLILFELRPHGQDTGNQQISFKQAFFIGIIQTISMIPGVSRSAATILGGLALGVDRKTIVEFSFFLAIPTMAAATGLDLLKTGASFTAHDFQLLATGFVVSFIVAWLSIKFLLRFVRTHTFIPFGIYRILAALLFWFFVLR